MSKMASKDDLHLVGFRIGRETFGVPIALVHEIVRVPEITAFPEAPDCVEGVINLRGRIIPVIDLRKRFGEKLIDTDNKNRILVTEVEGNRVGLIVDSASEVLRIPPNEIDALPMDIEEGKLNFITGVGKLNGRLIILVEMSKIFRRGLLHRLGDLAKAATPQSS
jgi:purine-binding chemotaxis protein CheW